MASTLYIQIPSKSAAEVAARGELESWEEWTLPFCLASAEKAVLQQGRQRLSDLRTLVQAASQVVLLLSTSDVNLLRVKVPPMPFAKIKQALPNLLEEQVLVDASELMFVALPPQDAQCTVAIISRVWLERIYAAVQVLGARRISAFASAAGLPQEGEESSVQIEIAQFCDANSTNDVGGADLSTLSLSVKTPDQLVAGLSLDMNALVHQPAAMSKDILESLQILVPHADVHFFLDTRFPATVSDALKAGLAEGRNAKFSDLAWQNKIAGLLLSTPDLFSVLNQEGQKSFDWMRWRWSIGITVLIVTISLLGLNWEWWKLQRETNGLRASINSTYKNTFPNETAIREPLVLMQQKINAAKKLAGHSTNDDFLVLSAKFGQSWDQSLGQSGTTMVSHAEYREHSLFVKPKNMSEVPIDKLRAALKQQNLKLEVKDGMLKVGVDIGDTR